ncbi:MAG: hypothetical protein NW241_14525 [Bacteroidia bacterium]|nr:hypothetical protein [Bacteroidia bacterium]
MPEPVRIANPLYDVVFRYLMDDERVARLVLTAILGETVEELEFESTEQSLKLGEAQITVTRMDFRARIQQAGGGSRLVLIELQKAKLYQQLMRFRRYLGQQYQQSRHLDPQGDPLPIYPVYILGEPFSAHEVPVIRVRRGYTDAATGEALAERHPFIEALTHDATIIQARYLQGRRRTELERFLSIFDQSAIADTKGHILQLDESDYPAPYQPVIRRLQRVLADPQLEGSMDLEDEVLAEFQRKDRELIAARQQAEEALQQAEEAMQQAEEARRREVQEQLRAEAERSAKNALIRRLHALGLGVAEIARDTGMEEAEVQRIVEG